MAKLELTQLIEAGAHFGHLTRRWNPKMKPYIFMEKKGIHIIDLKKTQQMTENAASAAYNIASTGKSFLFVGTKKQAKGVIAEQAKRSDSNWVSERWLGGMLTNFSTIRKSIKRLQNIDKMESDGTFEKITKKEALQLTRERDKLRKVLDGVETLGRLPGAIFIVDIKKESIAINEALRLNIPIFAIVDTNCDPDPVDYLIPANDDAVSTIQLITSAIADSIIEGSQKAKELKAEEAAERERQKKVNEETEEKKKGKKGRIRKVNLETKEEKSVEKKGAPKKPKTEKKEETETPKAEESKSEAVESAPVKETPEEKQEEKPEAKPDSKEDKETEKK
ncbi:MAG: 30S ribosomal protein S2 [Melioribacteraceae bacterium]|nr:30S ribosomal protein S2 [Melioribacteraceae bacterium]